MPKPLTPPHRFRFGLRTLFVLVTVVSIATAWVGYHVNWISQRHEFLRTMPDSVQLHALEREHDRKYPGRGGALPVRPHYMTVEYARPDWENDVRPPPLPEAPGLLWMFGEEPIFVIVTNPEDVEKAKRLFPEAEIFKIASWGRVEDTD